MSAGNIVHEMLQIFDRRHPSPRAIDLNTLIEQVISLQAPDVRDKGVAIECKLNPDLPLALADAAQIHQVLFNLLADASKSMSRSKESKKLTLRTGFTDEHVSLEVENNGGCVASVEPDAPIGHRRRIMGNGRGSNLAVPSSWKAACASREGE